MRVLLETLAFLLVVCLCLTVSSAQAVMLVHYPFDGDTTSVTNMAPGGGYEGILVGTAQIAYDLERESDVLELDGVDLGDDSSSVTISDREIGDTLLDLSLTGEATIAAWVYVERPILTYPHSVIFNQCSMSKTPYFGVRPDGQPAGALANAGPTVVTSTVAVPRDVWVHVAVTMSGDTSTFYIGGNPCGEDLDREGPIEPPEADYLSKIGMKPAGAKKWVFDGRMEDFRIYDNALTDEEIAVLAGVVDDPPPGDATRDGKVDDADAQVLAANWGSGTELDPAAWAEGNFDDDWIVGPSDAAILAAHWGTGVSEASSSVPEPGALILMGIGALMLLPLRRRSRG